MPLFFRIRCGRMGTVKERRKHAVKHRVTVEVETKKRFLGMPYTAREKKHIMVDGKTYRKMRKAEKEEAARREDEALACAAAVLEDEIADLFGE